VIRAFIISVVSTTACSGNIASKPVLPQPIEPSMAIAPTEVAPGEPAHAEPAKRLQQVLAFGTPRPEIVSSRRIDLARLPIARWDQAESSSRVRITASGPSAYRFKVDGVSFSEISVGDDFNAFTGDNFYRGAWPVCGANQKARRAAWRGFSQRGWTDAGVDVLMSRGAFDPRVCATTADTTLRVRAAALVEGWVYGFRMIDAGMTYLFVLTPHAALASATDDQATSGSFSIATLPLEPHRDAAAALRISPAALSAWRQMRRSRNVDIQAESAASALLLSIDIEAGATEDLGASLTLSLPRGAPPDEFASIVSATSGG
jgi:hypothetical protein